jgi:hypothetical protein
MKASNESLFTAKSSERIICLTISLLFYFFCFSSIVTATDLTRAEALEVVMLNVVDDDNNRVLVHSDVDVCPMATNYYLLDDTYITSPLTKDTWVFYIVYNPFTQIPDSISYVFINKDNGGVTEHTGYDEFPARWEDCVLEEGPEYNEIPSLFSYQNDPPRRDPPEDLWAILFHGGQRPMRNISRYWNEISAMYQVLIEYGYPEDHIFVIYGEGPDNPARGWDEWQEEEDAYHWWIDGDGGNHHDFFDSPMDLNGDEIDDVEYPATEEYLQEVFNEITAGIDENDFLFLWFCGQGWYGPGDDDISGWAAAANNDDDYRIEPNELTGMISELPDFQNLIAIFTTGSSGGFAEYLNETEDLDNVENIVSIGSWEYQSQGWSLPGSSDNVFDAYNSFSLPFISALKQFEPSADGPWLAGVAVDADINDDGEVTLWEAWRYSSRNGTFSNPDNVPDWIVDFFGHDGCPYLKPQYFSKSKGYGDRLILSEVLDAINIDLSIGWNLVSINYEPTDHEGVGYDLDVILDRFIEPINGSAYNPQSGQWLENDWWYDGDINFIKIEGEDGDLNPEEDTWDKLRGAYSIKLNSSDELVVPGSLIEDLEENTIELDGDDFFNYIAYLPNESYDCEDEVFAEIVDLRDNISIVKNGSGNFYIPDWEFDNINGMLVGEGYLVQTNDDPDPETLDYSLLGVGMAPRPLTKKGSHVITNNPTVHFTYTYPTDQCHAIVIPSFNYRLLENGDELGVFTPDGLCCGGVVLQDTGLVVIASWKDDETTENIDGYRDREPISLRFWDQSTNREITFGIVSSSANTPYFGEMPYSVFGLSDVPISTIPSEFVLYQNYPNPFNNGTLFKFKLPEAGTVEFSIYNVSGRKMATLINSAKSVGTHYISWNGQDLNANPLPSGNYIYEIVYNGVKLSSNFIILK